MATKAPSFPFYVRDYLVDTRGVSNSAKGIWCDLLCYMWLEPVRGSITRNIDNFSRMFSTTKEETLKAILELLESKICDVKINNEFVTCHTMSQNVTDDVTIINRRMYRESQQRINDRDRKRKERDNKGIFKKCHGHVTAKSTVPSFSSSFSSSKLNTMFNEFWGAYPIKGDRKKCFEKFKKIKFEEGLFEKIISAIHNQRLWRENAKQGEFRPQWKNPLTWINGECWNDEVYIEEEMDDLPI